jgi:hypothetical protein
LATKEAIISLDINSTDILPTNTVFYSQDFGSAKLTFNVYDDGNILDLTGVTSGKIAFLWPDGTSASADCALDDLVNGVVSYTPSKEDLLHIGSITAELDLYYGTSTGLSVGQFQFNVKQSLIDKISSGS